MKNIIIKFIDWGCLALVSAVFMLAGISKLLDFQNFPEEIEAYRIIPESLVGYFALYLVFFEILIAVALLIPVLRLAACYFSVLLNAMFCIAIISALIRGIDISCGCFGKDYSEFLGNGLQFLLRDLIFLGITIRLVYFSYTLEHNKYK